MSAKSKSTHQPKLKLPFEYRDTPETRVIDLEPEGVPCVPVIEQIGYGHKVQEPPEHVHPECLEIVYCRGGELIFESGGERRPFRPGMVFVSRPNEPHRLASLPRGTAFYGLFFRIPRGDFPLLRLPTDEARWLKRKLTSLPRRLFKADASVPRLFRRIFHIYDTAPKRTPERRFLIRTAVTDLLLAIVESAESDGGRETPNPIESLVAEMRAHPEGKFPLHELAERFGITSETLRLRFRKITGIPPHAFLVARRIDRAKEMLRDSDVSVASIADRLGFSSPQNFATQFRLATGTTPLAWRSGLRERA